MNSPVLSPTFPQPQARRHRKPAACRRVRDECAPLVVIAFPDHVRQHLVVGAVAHKVDEQRGAVAHDNSLVARQSGTAPKNGVECFVRSIDAGHLAAQQDIKDCDNNCYRSDNQKERKGKNYRL